MIEIHIKTTALHLENLSDQLLLLGAHAITWLDAANQPIYEPAPGEIIPWQTVSLVALFDNDHHFAAIGEYLLGQQQASVLTEYQFIETPKKDWVRASLDQFHPMQYGNRLWIVPSWLTPPNLQACNVLIDPGLAFGTGTHPTTSLCLQWLDGNICGGETIIDYGCGSGILAIAALKLGASKAIALDYDDQALQACQLNAILNAVADKITTLKNATEDEINAADIVIANILAKTIIEHKAIFQKLVKPQAKLILSGILSEQAQTVIATYQPEFSLVDISQQDEWVRISLQYQGA